MSGLVGATLGQVGLGRQLGGFLRSLESNELVLITYEDAGRDVLGTVFRAVELSPSNLEPGDYTFPVEIELDGRELMTVGRPISIVPNPADL